MSSDYIVLDSPRPISWLFHMGSNLTLAREFTRDHRLFACFFASAGPFIDWPEKLSEQLTTNAHQDPALHPNSLAMLGDMTRVMGVQGSAEFLGILRDSTPAFNYYRGDAIAFRDLCLAHLESLGDLLSMLWQDSVIENKLEALHEICPLSELERDVLAFATLIPLDTEKEAIYRILASKSESLLRQALMSSFGVNAKALAELVDSSWLTQSGLVSFRASQSYLPETSQFWLEHLVAETALDDSFVTGLIKPITAQDSSDSVARLPETDRGVIQSLLKSRAKRQPLHILLYGDKSLDKRGLASALLAEAGVTGWEFEAKRAESRDYPVVCFIAQHFLRKHHPNAVLVIENSPQVLTHVGQSPIAAFFGMAAAETSREEGFDSCLMTKVPLKTIWLANSPRNFRQDTLAAFTYHSEVKTASRAERKAEIEAMVASLPISDGTKAELVKMTGVSKKQLSSAILLAKMVGGRSQAKIDKALLHAVTRSQKALGRVEVEELRTPVTTYSLEFLNTTGKFKPDQIISALKRNPSASLCFHGLPGTGKTQLAEHIALQLDKPILMKRASELIDKYIGESEKNIAAMFQEAEEEGAVLLLDEADSFLRDRSMARQAWEVSQVNELLQRMERFRGTFICATNLFSQLDAASLRRFTFKLEFQALTNAQRWAMFLTETGLQGSAAATDPDDLRSWQKKVNSIQYLTPGDFATVKRQCLVLSQDLSPAEWLAQLEAESSAKLKSLRQETGQTLGTMGFLSAS